MQDANIVVEQILQSLPDTTETDPASADSFEDISHNEAVFLIEQAARAASTTAPDTESTDPRPEELSMGPPMGFTAISDDKSEPVPHYTSPYAMDNFHFLLGLWCIDTNLSREQYASLLEVLKTLRSVCPIQTLPVSLSTLKKNCKGQIPIIPIRRKKIPVISSKLPTLSAAEKSLAQSGATWLYFMDSVALLSSLIKSSLFMGDMYRGMAHLVDKPSELWHSFSWGSSIRTTSREFALYPDGMPVFPSDILYYRCDTSGCACAHHKTTHIGRVEFVGKNFMSKTDPRTWGNKIIQTGILLQHHDVTSDIHQLIEDPPFSNNELIVHEDSSICLRENQIIAHEPAVILDYEFKNGFSKRILQPVDKFIIRRILNFDKSSVRPLNLSSPLRGELELKTYGRRKLLDKYYYRNCVSFPYQLFIDGFGMYRTVYHSTMGIYLIPAGLSADHRAKRRNLFPITLGPHGTNFTDVIESLHGLTVLDQGCDINMTDDSVVSLNAFCLAFLGDMPQQNDNAGFKRPTATYSCRQCLVKDSERSNLDYNTVSMGRYHNQILQLRQIASQKSGKAKDKFCQEYGLSLNPSPLFAICPSLNLVSFFPSDPCHSEYAGIAKMSHILLLENILSSSGARKYITILRSFPFPSGWGRIQSPGTHIESYNLQEHARASIVIPLLLRCYLCDDWIEPTFYIAMNQIYDPAFYSVKHVIVSVYAAIARSNSVLAWRSMQEKDRHLLKDIIIHARRGLQSLIEVAAIAAEEIQPTRSRSRSTSTLSLSQHCVPGSSRDNSPASIVWASKPIETKKSIQLRALQNRPNIHIGLHYVQQSREYAVTSNCNVLAGEDKHR
ncbi:hypothetical protein AFLA70_169g002151 [Aspergillus flavus AF70]|nr:hypothetical protein AFLA70_169g002151 [Aspergillus flavus AF70]